MPGRTTLNYTARHRHERARWQRLLRAGLRLQCACVRTDCPLHRGHCTVIISKDTPFDLGHDDWDRSRWTGPECVGCNRRAGGRQRTGELVRPVPVIRRPATASRW
jgi:hypothetical protein